MPVSAAELSKRLDTGLPPVVLVFGDEPLLIEETGDLVRNRALHLGYEERLVLHATESKFDWGRLTETAQSLSLFSERRLIDLRLPTARPGDAGGKAIVEFCGSASEDVALLIICGRMEARVKQSKWFKAVEGCGVAVEHRPVAAAQLPGWINTRARTRGLTIEPEGVQLLAYFTEGNLLAAAQEIDKLRLLPTDQGVISSEDVSNSITDNARFTAYTLVNQCLAGNAKQALRTLGGLRREGIEPILIVWVLAKQVRTLYRLAAGTEAGKQKARLFKELGVWYKQESLIGPALARRGLDDWAGLLKDMSVLDRMVKGRNSGNVWDALERACLFICGVDVLKQT